MARRITDDGDTGGNDPGLPPAFDAAYYLAANPDLALSPDEAAGHYDRTGRAEGRVASPLALRENLIARIAGSQSVLEIGPFCRPLLRGANIAYLDILDADQLRARAIEIGADPSGCPDRIDYVGGLEQVRRRFDAVISSHAIEHQPDLVHHLAQVARILEPDGLLCLIIPDKRYCFDHYIAESTIAQVVQAHREQRRTHSLASVIEHVALTTHNESERHWSGDHGTAVPADRAVRIGKAIHDHDFGLGRYIDVHAWYFTPGSFRQIIEMLVSLGLSDLELAEVYDTVHGRNEFCAVLRLTPAARQRAKDGGGQDGIIFLQTSDSERYAPMLAVTATNVREYCRRHGHGYESFVGIKRGIHPWQATFNRIPMLVELAGRGFVGWAVYLDADAWVQDLDFDLAAYLADKGDRAAIFATSGVTGEAWDVNAGVALINLGHPQGRRLVGQWASRFAAHDDDFLRDAVEWIGPGNDQDLLHQILQQDRDIADAVLVEPMTFINGPHAGFIRQQLRTMGSGLEDRLASVARFVSEVMRGAGLATPAAPSAADSRWSGRLAHPEGRLPALVEAPLPAPSRQLAERIVAAWSPDAEPPAHQGELVDALVRGDAGAVADQLAGLGRARAAEGILGGARQHERARNPQFAERLVRWTYDKLVSLAEAVGALRLENPERGGWGDNMLADPAELFRDIAAALGADLAPPAHVGSYLGIAIGNGAVLHMRMLDAIHAAWRLRQLAEALGLAERARIAEIGGGAGFTACYALRLGLTRYRLFDRPAMNAIQAHILIGDGQDAALAGEPARPAAILPETAFTACEPGSIDILFNSDAPLGADADAAISRLRDACHMDIRHILSINEEAGPPGNASMSDLIRSAGGYRLASRHRHWLRAGYVEEHYIRIE